MTRKAVSSGCDPLFVDGKPIPVSSLTATDAKNEFGQVLELVAAGRAVVITKHEAPKAVMISYEEFLTLSGRGERQLNALRAEFDDLLARLQTPAAKTGLEAAFAASPAQLGAAALAAVRKRR